MPSKSRILLFTGPGKGKTTAALGMVLRALGHGMRPAVFQFIKDDATTGELNALKAFPAARIEQLGRGFIPAPTAPAFAGHRQAATAGLDRAAAALASGAWDLVVLDEINNAVAKRLLDEADVVAAVRSAAPQTMVVLTGRGATAGLMALADTVTEMQVVKHGLEAGLPACKGVEF